MRRTKLQRQMHRRLVEEGLVAGHPGGQIVRMLAATYGLTLRQARLDLQQVQAGFRRQDDELRQNRWKLADLTIASDRCDREFRAAVEAGDAARAMLAEKHRCKLLGIYHADRRRTPHMPLDKRMAIGAKFKSDLTEMYAEAPRNADGSVVLTHFSLTPPPVDDRRYRESIEQPLSRGPSPKRRERIDTMRAMLAAGGRMDQLEAAACTTYHLSWRQVRADVRRARPSRGGQAPG